MKKEKMKMKVFLLLYVASAVFVFIGAYMVLIGRADNAGYAVVPMVFALIFAMFYRNSKKAIEENKQQSKL
jgi:uncharacterized membrane protein YfcA